MSPREGSVALLGFPRTGKSTYLGAVWQLAQDPQEPSVLELDVTGDRSYLQRLGDKVARAEELGRTEISSLEGMRLTLRFPGGDVAIDAPDLGGETLRLLVEDRVVHERLEASLVASTSMLMFLHPEKLELPMSISMADELLRASAAVPTPQPKELPKFEARAACTTAKHLDALENVLMHRRDNWPVRLGVIVSAWDMVHGSPTPETWLQDNAPALVSFLDANKDMVVSRLFGVSAQGGRLPQDRNELLARGSLRERAYAREADGSTVSVAEPLRWAVLQ